MVTILITIAVVWFALACVFVLALCFAARRKSLPPQTEQPLAAIADERPDTTECRARPPRRRLWLKPWRARHVD